MAKFRIVSDNTDLGKPGELVDSADLEGYNVEALVEGGHLAEVAPSSSKAHKSSEIEEK